MDQQEILPPHFSRLTKHDGVQQQQGYYGEVRLPVADAVKYSSSYSVSYVDVLLEGEMTPVVCASGLTSSPR